MTETLSQNTNEEDFGRFDVDSMSDGRSSKKSGRGSKGVRQIYLVNSSALLFFSLPVQPRLALPSLPRLTCLVFVCLVLV